MDLYIAGSWYIITIGCCQGFSTVQYYIPYIPQYRQTLFRSNLEPHFIYLDDDDYYYYYYNNRVFYHYDSVQIPARLLFLQPVSIPVVLFSRLF